ncbi:hypothetical protein NQZ68_035959 [Dissostichus eleginoides]|nr:hypothetical protein NQZ68_035959 [Dissostichus eleginoides]
MAPAKKKRAAYNVTVPTPHDDNRLFTISLSEDQAEEETQYDRFPPRYSTMDLPPPYSLVRNTVIKVTAKI